MGPIVAIPLCVIEALPAMHELERLGYRVPVLWQRCRRFIRQANAEHWPFWRYS